MADNRKILVAKRKNERGDFSRTHIAPNQKDDGNERKNLKRQTFPKDSCKKNTANDRLKRLRTSLNEDAQKSAQHNTSNSYSNKVSKGHSRARKRRPNNNYETVSSKTLIKDEESTSNVSSDHGFVFKEEFTSQNTFFKTSTENPFSMSKVLEVQSSSRDDEVMEWTPTDDTPQTVQSVSNNNSNESVSRDLFIVIDTNIFLSQLQLIRDILGMKVAGNETPIIFIPWIVIEELDFIKEGSSKPKFKAQDAIKFIEKNLTEKHARMRGQTLDEANEQKNVGKSQDNKIIACCMQVLEKHKNMILLTNDINLKNKAHINHIPVCSHDQIMAKIPSLLNNNKAQIILQKMTDLCIRVIHECAKSAYGDVCSRMPICQSTPNTFEECLNLFTKYWFTVFEQMLMKQFKKSVDDLHSFLRRNKLIKNDSKEVSELARLCVRMCLFLKDVDCCKDLIERTIRDVNNVKEL